MTREYTPLPYSLAASPPGNRATTDSRTRAAIVHDQLAPGLNVVAITSPRNKYAATALHVSTALDIPENLVERCNQISADVLCGEH